MDTQKARTGSLQQLQSGQAIVFVALMMLGLMAALGLAIDGGGLFFLHRDTQNATDAAVIAATYARCTSSVAEVVEFAGYEAAERNGFANDATTNWVTVNNPPDTGTGAGDPAYVEVMITANKPSYFIQLVFPGPLQVTSRAVGRCSPPFEPGVLPALMGLSRTCPNTVDLTGSEITVESDPAMVSNNEIHASGSNTTVDGAVTAVTSVSQNPSGNTNYLDGYQTGAQYYQDDPLGEHFSLREFAPGGGMWERATVKTEIGPASADFSNGTWSPNGQTLNGLYYVNGDVQINNATIGLNGITLAATGEIQFSSGANLFYHVGGFLFVSGASTDCSNAMRLSGSNVQWYGLIYAPHGGVDISGSDLNIIGSVIAQSIDFSASRTRIVYDPDLLDPIPASVVVSE